jgi:DNA polymerase
MADPGDDSTQTRASGSAGAARAELGVLASALAALVRRQRSRGHRRAAGAPRPAERRATANGPTVAAAIGAKPAPGPILARPLGSVGAPVKLAASPVLTPSSGRVSAEQRGRAELLRQQAASCRTLEELRGAVAACTACELCRTRTQTVFSDGDGSSGVLFVGEAPGQTEDEQGVPFVGRAGQLLSDIIAKGMGLDRKRTYVANVLKCRPPENRDPTEVEKTLCTAWLDRQIELVDPRVVVPLGRHAANHVLGTDLSMGALRGKVHTRGTRSVVPTFHPAYLLRSPSEKKECWKDIQLAMGILGLSAPTSRPSLP